MNFLAAAFQQAAGDKAGQVNFIIQECLQDPRQLRQFAAVGDDDISAGPDCIEDGIAVPAVGDYQDARARADGFQPLDQNIGLLAALFQVDQQEFGAYWLRRVRALMNESVIPARPKGVPARALEVTSTVSFRLENMINWIFFGHAAAPVNK